MGLFGGGEEFVVGGLMDVEIKGVLEGVSVGESLEGCGGPGGGLAAGEVGGCVGFL